MFIALVADEHETLLMNMLIEISHSDDRKVAK